MFETLLYQSIKRGEPAFSGWCTIPSPYTARIMAGTGCQAVTIDLQHALIDDATAINMFMALARSPVTRLARVGWNDPFLIMRALDYGAEGVICPMINTQEEAAAFVEACFYPPVGNRSFGPYAPMLFQEEGYETKANASIIPIAMIETSKAIDNLANIAKVPNLRGLFVGPKDLTLSLTGQGRVDFDNPDFQVHLRAVVDAAHQNNLLACSHVPHPEKAGLLKEIGFDILFLSDDTKLLKGAASSLFNVQRD